MGRLRNRKEVSVCAPDNGSTFCAAPGGQVALWTRVYSRRASTLLILEQRKATLRRVDMEVEEADEIVRRFPNDGRF